MAYEAIGTVWVDYTTSGETPCAPGYYRMGTVRPIRCSQLNSGDTAIPLSQIDTTKYDIVQSLNSGSQVVAKGGSWSGAFTYANYGGCPSGQVRPTPDGPCVDPKVAPTASTAIATNVPVVTPGGILGANGTIDTRTAEYCRGKGGSPVYGQDGKYASCVYSTGVVHTVDGQVVDPNTGLTKKSTGSNTMLYLGLALGVAGVGVYLYKKRRRK